MTWGCKRRKSQSWLLPTQKEAKPIIPTAAGQRVPAVGARKPPAHKASMRWH